jgi:hypothetical protein
MDGIDKALLDALRAVRDRMSNRASWDAANGICPHVSWELRRAHPESHSFQYATADRLSALMAEWPGYSGSDLYPVPAPGLTAPLPPALAYLFASATEMWDREVSQYAENRWQLLEWLIATLEASERPTPVTEDEPK